jgi:hypothetical protein
LLPLPFVILEKIVRIEQPLGKRGSLKWIQRLVQNHPRALNEQLVQAGALSAGSEFDWASPLKQDGFAEYRDADFLKQIGHPQLATKLRDFWPNRGPQWDALAVEKSGRVYIFEAKAHAAEMASSCKAGPASRQKIEKACAAAKQTLGANPDSDWLAGYYQYANRLAHLGFLRDNGIEAWLVFIYFTGDSEMAGPATQSEWCPFIDAAHRHLGLKEHAPWVVSVFQPVAGI